MTEPRPGDLLRAMKMDLERNISMAIETFQEQTGLAVTQVKVDFYDVRTKGATYPETVPGPVVVQVAI